MTRVLIGRRTYIISTIDHARGQPFMKNNILSHQSCSIDKGSSNNVRQNKKIMCRLPKVSLDPQESTGKKIFPKFENFSAQKKAIYIL